MKRGNMNIEIKKLSFKDYIISRVEMEKVKLLISLGVIWAYVIYDMERKGNGAGLQTILKEYTLPALILSLGINIFVFAQRDTARFQVLILSAYLCCLYLLNIRDLLRKI